MKLGLFVGFGLVGAVLLSACGSAPTEATESTASSHEAIVSPFPPSHPVAGGQCFGPATHFKMLPCPPGFVCVGVGIDTAFCEPAPVETPCDTTTSPPSCPPEEFCVEGLCHPIPHPTPITPATP